MSGNLLKAPRDIHHTIKSPVFSTLLNVQYFPH